MSTGNREAVMQLLTQTNHPQPVYGHRRSAAAAPIINASAMPHGDWPIPTLDVTTVRRRS
jgi:hypothetical protein